MAADDRTVLSYYDSLLRESDVKLLDKGQWLNDNIIGFVFEYFANHQYAKFASEVSYITPGVTQFIKLAEGSEVDIFLEPLGLASRRMVFLAVNDNAETDAVGGSHWSLLMYDRQENKFWHYDSSTPANHDAAQQIVHKVTPYITAESKPVFEEATCPKQTNGSDCGVYVLCVLEQLCNAHLTEQFTDQLPVQLKAIVVPEFVARRRHEIKQLIQRLAASQKSDCS